MTEKEKINRIQKQHIFQAIAEIKSEGIRRGRHSSAYNLDFEGELYPPKLVISIAHRFAVGEELDPNEFEGGKGTEAFKRLEFLGFKIVDKNDPLQGLIDNYKNFIRRTKMQDEVYKWKLLKEFAGRPDTNVADFSEEIRAVKFQNLMYQMAFAVTRHIAKDSPEDFRKCFIDLFDESKPLHERMQRFNQESLKVYRALGETLGHHQDERTMATYLTFHDPSRYTFYKSSFYKPLCELMGEKPAGKFRKYGHYLQLLNAFIDKYIRPDQELIEMVRSYIPEYYDGSNNLLLAQDILFCILDREKDEKDVDYWIFQGNPKRYDFKRAIAENAIDIWTVSAHRDKIKEGDKLILWITGNEGGVCALGEVTKKPFPYNEEQDEYWNDEDRSSYKAGIKLTHVFADQPITKQEIEEHHILKEMKVGLQGSNFAATKEQYDTILQMNLNGKDVHHWVYAPGENAVLWNSFYSDGVMGLGWNELGDLSRFSSKDEINNELQKIHGVEYSKRNDSKANWDFVHTMKPGDLIVVNKGRNVLLGYGYVTSEYYYDPTRKDYHHVRKVDWKKKGEWKVDYQQHAKTLTDISWNKIDNPNFPQFQYYHELLLASMSDSENKLDSKPMAINQILYGPPGTGKTFTLKKDYFSIYTSKETSITSDQYFESVVRDLTWWQVIAIAVKEMGECKVGDIARNEWVVKKAKLSNSNTVRPTIWGQLQSHTVESCEFVNVKSKQQPFIFNKSEDSFWTLVEEELNESYPEIYEIIDSVKNFNPDPDKEIKRYVFTTFHQSYSYEDFIEGIKPLLVDGENNGEVNYRIEDGVFKDLCKRAELDPENRYAIFIDEINRANVSGVFGELITLIERDKRKGAENAMSAVLPYSKKSFSVPENVDIYGTMNTADRSVEALDTALRRRFSFVEILPDPELLKDKKIEGVELKKLLEVINERIEVLVDRDHTVGHAFFINDTSLNDLRNTFANKIIPLLQEYFYGDYSKMEMVIGSAFFEVKEVSKVKFAVKSDDFDAEGKVYHIKNIADKETMSDDAFKNALNQLIAGQA